MKNQDYSNGFDNGYRSGLQKANQNWANFLSEQVFYKISNLLEIEDPSNLLMREKLIEIKKCLSELGFKD